MSSNISGPEEILREALHEFGLDRALLDDPIHADNLEEVRFYLVGLLDGLLGRRPRVKWEWDVEDEQKSRSEGKRE